MMFATKGFAQTKISDISSAVGIGESTVYEHHKGKEDILFAIPKEKTQQLIDLNEQHLKGLVGGQVKLRKLIYNYFAFLVSDRFYTTLLLFELRKTRTFYSSDHYGHVKQFVKPYREAILEGQKGGEFSCSLSPTIALNMIFGAIDHILLTWIIRDNPRNPLEYFETLVDLVFHAIATRATPPPSDDKRKQILNAAASVFAKMGYNAARIQDIAKLAGVADGTIYQYFANKQELLFALPVQKTEELISIQREHIAGIKDAGLRLSVLITDYLQYCDANRDYTSIFIFDLRYERDFYQSKGYELFREFAREFYETIVIGKTQGLVRKEADAYIAVKMILGLIDHCLIGWLLFSKPQSIANLCNPISSLALSALKY